MDKNHKITIPQPCHENWNKMTPKDNGRFCLSCTKTVVDFTLMLPEEIQYYFNSNQNQSICGRLKKSQLDEVIIQIPTRVLYSQTHYQKMFFLALFIAMGTTLFSCQDKNGNKQKIDKIEVVKNKSVDEGIYVGEAPISKNDAKHPLIPPPPPPKIDHTKFVKSTESATSKKSKSEKTNNKKNNAVKNEVIYNGGVAIETNAEFPGGIEGFYTFFGKEFKNPENIDKEDKKFRIAFAVEKDGSVSYLKQEENIDENIEKEVIRVLALCPKWQPGQINGKKVKRQYSLPIALH